MAYVAVDLDGEEWIYLSKPEKKRTEWCLDTGEDVEIQMSLPKGSIRKLIGKDLTFTDDPFEIK